MKSFITSHLKLAKAVGITPQYLSVLKKSNTASDLLLEKLETTTGIAQIFWASPTRNKDLLRKLAEFLKSERAGAKKASEPTHHEPNN